MARRVAVCLAFAVIAAPSPGSAQQIPALHWRPRSDWINVKVDVTPRAAGDGAVDDTTALQAGIDRLS